MMTPRPSPSAAGAPSLQRLDQVYRCVQCLGRGGFGSVFLARKQSGRQVALKVFHLDEDGEDGPFESFHREVEVLTRLQQPKLIQPGNNNGKENRDLALVYMEDSFDCLGTAGIIVLKYADGGTLADHILMQQEQQNSFFSERRIAWYALQLCEALGYFVRI